MGIHPPRPPLDVYPGTSRPLGTPIPADGTWSPTLHGWDESPIYKRQQGTLREFFGIGHLATALGRSTKTIYKWEKSGLFPKATFVYNGTSRHGQRRLYTRTQIEGVVKIASDEGILRGSKRYIGETLFPVKCAELFQTTKGILPPPIDEWETND